MKLNTDQYRIIMRRFWIFLGVYALKTDCRGILKSKFESQSSTRKIMFLDYCNIVYPVQFRIKYYVGKFISR